MTELIFLLHFYAFMLSVNALYVEVLLVGVFYWHSANSASVALWENVSHIGEISSHHILSTHFVAIANDQINISTHGNLAMRQLVLLSFTSLIHLNC